MMRLVGDRPACRAAARAPTGAGALAIRAYVTATPWKPLGGRGRVARRAPARRPSALAARAHWRVSGAVGHATTTDRPRPRRAPRARARAPGASCPPPARPRAGTGRPSSRPFAAAPGVCQARRGADARVPLTGKRGILANGADGIGCADHGQAALPRPRQLPRGRPRGAGRAAAAESSGCCPTPRRRSGRSCGSAARSSGQLELDPKLRELAIIQVAADAEADYEWVQHVAIARDVGGVRRADRGRRGAAAWTIPRSARASVRCCGSRARSWPDRGSATRRSRTSEERLSPQEIVELLLTVGNYLMLARVMTTLELELDDPAGGRSSLSSGCRASRPFRASSYAFHRAASRGRSILAHTMISTEAPTRTGGVARRSARRPPR